MRASPLVLAWLLLPASYPALSAGSVNADVQRELNRAAIVIASRLPIAADPVTTVVSVYTPPDAMELVYVYAVSDPRPVAIAGWASTRRALQTAICLSDEARRLRSIGARLVHRYYTLEGVFLGAVGGGDEECRRTGVVIP